MESLNLSQKQLSKLENSLSKCTDVRIFKRTLGLLEVARGKPISQVASLLGVDRRSVYNWIKVYKSSPTLKSISDAPRSGRPSLWTQDIVRCLEAALMNRPDDYGYRAMGWTTSLLREHIVAYKGIKIADDTIREKLHELGYVWKRPRYVLLPDPDHDKKNA